MESVHEVSKPLEQASFEGSCSKPRPCSVSSALPPGRRRHQATAQGPVVRSRIHPLRSGPWETELRRPVADGEEVLVARSPHEPLPAGSAMTPRPVGGARETDAAFPSSLPTRRTRSDGRALRPDSASPPGTRCTQPWRGSAQTRQQTSPPDPAPCMPRTPASCLRRTLHPSPVLSCGYTTQSGLSAESGGGPRSELDGSCASRSFNGAGAHRGNAAQLPHLPALPGRQAPNTGPTGTCPCARARRSTNPSEPARSPSVPAVGGHC